MDTSILSKSYIVDIVDGSRIIFDYIPTEITDEKSASYTPTSIIGRSEPIMGYGSSEPRTIGMALEFIVSKFQSDGGTYAELKRKVAWLRSLVCPDYSGAMVQPPHVCLLKVGDLLSQRVIILSCSVTYKGPWNANLLPYLVSVNLGFQECNVFDSPFGLHDVRNGTDIYRGMS